MEEETQTKKPSLLGMITSPIVQFKRIEERPNIWMAMIIITIVYVIGAWITSQNMEVAGEFNLTEEELEGTKTMMKAGMVFGGLVAPIFTVLVSSAIYMLVGAIAHTGVSFKQLFSMNTYIMVIGALSTIVNTILALAIGSNPEELMTSLGSIIEVKGAIGGLVDSLELFSIWNVIITALGLHYVANFSKGLAWTVSIAFFVIGVIFTMIAAVFSGMAGV